MPTTRQDLDFAEEMKNSVDEVKMSHSSLDNAIIWIGDNLDPGDVFSEEKLKDWAEDNGWIKKE